MKKYIEESKKIWNICGPAFFVFLCQYSLGAITQTFLGRVGTLELAAFSIENSLIANFAFGIMLGLGSALETLCGQAFGAGQQHMLGIYMQRSWVILNSISCLLIFLYIFATPILKLIKQDPEIAEASGKIARLMIPQLFAYAMNFPLAKFLQAQSRVMVMAAISGIVVVLHVFFSWLVILRLRWGMVGGAVVLDCSWWLIVIAQFVYVVSGRCGGTWTGFSTKAFANLWGYLKLSLVSAVMLCLEVWYYAAVLMIAGFLRNAKISIDALSISLTIVSWVNMVALGFYTGVSVRVSNELGAGRPHAAKFAVVVAVSSSFAVGLVISFILLMLRKQYPVLFTSSKEVQEYVSTLTLPLVLSIIINNIQPVLSGVAVGAGWQALVACVNIGSYYLVGVPFGLLLGCKLHKGIKGIWYGMLFGTAVQTLILLLLTYRTNWNKEATDAKERLEYWRGNNHVNGAEETEAREMTPQRVAETNS
ncbi:hypothetical protein RND81_11G013500 [Saponaria officinalis]